MITTTLDATEENLDYLDLPPINRLAMAQLNPISGALDANTTKIIEAIEQGRDAGAELITLPEMAITGYCVADLVEYEEFVQENKLRLERIAASTAGTAAVVGFVDYDPNERNEDGSLRKYNAAAVFSDGKLVGIVHKQNLPNYRYFDDKRYFAEGSPSDPITIKVGDREVKIGVAICEDIWDEHYAAKVVRDLADKGAEMIVSVNASPYAEGKYDERHALIKKHVQEVGIPFVYQNTAGVADNGKNLIPFAGESGAYDKHGNLISLAKPLEEELKIVDFASLSGVPVERPKRAKEEEFFNTSVMALRDYMAKCGFEKAIVPVSGGIDSALGLAIAVEAVGAENVIAYNLPTKHNSNETRGIAQRMCEAFGVEYKVMPIQDIVDANIKTYEMYGRKLEDKVAYENLQARIRGELMMLESNNIPKSMLISCGNRTEIALGYCTLYGDMAGGVSVIGDYNKIEVYKTSRYVNERFGREMIPWETFEIAASAELSDGQVDPFDYAVDAPLVDDLLAGLSPSEVIEMFKKKTLNEELWEVDSHGKSVYDKYNLQEFAEVAEDRFRKILLSVYKRLQGAPIISLKKTTMGFDRRETLINHWRGIKFDAAQAV